MICKPSFFGLKKLPVLDLSEVILKAIAEETVNKGLTVPGVQKKISLHLIDGENSRLTLVGYPAGYILKPQTEEYASLPETEDLTMDMAEATDIKVVPHGLIELQTKQYAYITKRVDRIGNKKFAMEDFCQLSERLTEDKYKGSYEQCAKIIREYSSRPGVDIAEFFLRLVFCFVTGNSDMHLKNFSLMEYEPGSFEYILSPAYDLLPVNIVNPLDTEETALTMLGKKNNLRGKDFLIFAKNISLADKVAERLIEKVVSQEDVYLQMIENSFLKDDLKAKYSKLIQDRIQRLL